MMTTPFNFARLPELYFGAGKISALASKIKSFGQSVLVVVGGGSFHNSESGRNVLASLQAAKLNIYIVSIPGEPSPQMVDEIVNRFAGGNIDVVVGIGGGSVLDAGKAISAMLPLNEPVKDYLEGVGTKATHPGVKTPYIAVPTTSGTGSEATKNAVLSETGNDGYKKSLRHNNFVPDVALVDPGLTITCSSSVTAASGMDAFTQLLESYLSTTANSVTDALVIEGLQCISRSLIPAYNNGTDLAARTDMALASYLSGVTLANAGLGLVHGYASVIGGYYAIPHGVICSALMPVVNDFTVKKLRATKGDLSLKKYAFAGRMFSAEEGRSDSFYIDAFIDKQYQWRELLKIPKLSSMIAEEDVVRIASASENKNNPAVLDEAERIEILRHS